MLNNFTKRIAVGVFSLFTSITSAASSSALEVRHNGQTSSSSANIATESEKPILGWRNTLDFSSDVVPKEQEIIKNVLDKLFNNEYGQKELLKLNSVISNSGKEKITISTLKKLTDKIPFGSETIYFRTGVTSKRLDKFNINLEDTNNEYMGKDGVYHKFSPERVIAHEIIGHGANESLTKREKNAPSEQIAKDITNKFLSKVLPNDPPRGDYFDTKKSIVEEKKTHFLDKIGKRVRSETSLVRTIVAMLLSVAILSGCAGEERRRPEGQQYKRVVLRGGEADILKTQKSSSQKIKERSQKRIMQNSMNWYEVFLRGLGN